MLPHISPKATKSVRGFRFRKEAKNSVTQALQTCTKGAVRAPRRGLTRRVDSDLLNLRQPGFLHLTVACRAVDRDGRRNQRSGRRGLYTIARGGPGWESGVCGAPSKAWGGHSVYLILRGALKNGALSRDNLIPQRLEPRANFRGELARGQLRRPFTGACSVPIQCRKLGPES